MKIKLVADSSANIKTLDNALYSTSAMRIVVGDKEFIDDDNVNNNAMEKKVDFDMVVHAIQIPSR